MKLFAELHDTDRLKHRQAYQVLFVLILILGVLTASVPGILAVMRRADAQVALGNAKTLRMALQAASMEAYAAGEPFGDASRTGGLAGDAWKKVMMSGKVPGDFWVIQTDESGYEVLRFLYREGDFTVSYCKEPLTYEVYYRKVYIQTENHAVY